jgi:hypothetical protein
VVVMVWTRTFYVWLVKLLWRLNLIYLSIYVLLNIMLIHPCMIMLRICGCALLIHVSVILCLFKLYHYLVT